MHYPVTFGWLQFENCFIASQVQILLEKEGKTCMQEKKKQQHIYKTKVWIQIVHELHFPAVSVSTLLPESPNPLSPLLKVFYNIEFTEKTKEGAAKTFSLLFNFQQGT